MAPICTIYYCYYEGCTAHFKKKERYETHIRSHTGERPYICSFPGCGNSYRRDAHLKRHTKSHESSYKSFKCTVEGCCEVLKTAATLKNHIDVIHKHKKPKKFKCDVCNQEFNKHNWLESHKARYHDMKRFVCTHPGCERTYNYPSRLKKHMKVHYGYKCTEPDCGEVSEKWNDHVKHTKEAHRKVFECGVCSRVFSTSHNLKEHCGVHQQMRVVFECEEPNCTRFYLAKKNLKVHVRDFHMKRPFNCAKENCFKSFKTQEQLDNHIANHESKRPLRKKKKKLTRKPTFTERLAGYVHPGATEADQTDLTSIELNSERATISCEENLHRTQPESKEDNEMEVSSEVEAHQTESESDADSEMVVEAHQTDSESSIEMSISCEIEAHQTESESDTDSETVVEVHQTESESSSEKLIFCEVEAHQTETESDTDSETVVEVHKTESESNSETAVPCEGDVHEIQLQSNKNSKIRIFSCEVPVVSSCSVGYEVIASLPVNNNKNCGIESLTIYDCDNASANILPCSDVNMSRITA